MEQFIKGQLIVKVAGLFFVDIKPRCVSLWLLEFTKGTNMIGYLNKVRGGWVLTICAKPCSGEEFNNSEKIPVSGKREAKKICQERGCSMWNF